MHDSTLHHDEDEVICVCQECFSELNSSRVEKNAFYKDGGSPSCTYCGGVTSIISRGEFESFKESMTKKRGIGSTI